VRATRGFRRMCMKSRWFKGLTFVGCPSLQTAAHAFRPTCDPTVCKRRCKPLSFHHHAVPHARKPEIHAVVRLNMPFCRRECNEGERMYRFCGTDGDGPRGVLYERQRTSCPFHAAVDWQTRARNRDYPAHSCSQPVFLEPQYRYLSGVKERIYKDHSVCRLQ
jgi:hypothetical protein